MNIIVTGTSRGLGFEIARIFSMDRQNVVFALSRSKEGLLRLKEACSKSDDAGNVHIFPFDLLGDDYQKLLAEILKRMKKVDILVNNAGLMINKPFDVMDGTDFDRMFQANVKSAFNLTRCLLPYFNENAHIVNIGSMGGFQGSVKFPGLSLYSASKGALAILTECLAEEFKERKIKVNCLAIGSVQTEMLKEAFPGYTSPLSADDMAEFVADFALKGHRYFNGKILPVAVTTP